MGVRKVDDVMNELVNACSEVLTECEKYEHLWDQGYIQRYLRLYGGFIAQDESFNVGVCRKKQPDLLGKFAFTGHNFGSKDCELDACSAASLMHAWYFGCKITGEQLKNCFYESLKKPLGEYYAQKGLESIGLG
ncbi:hypothetical protein GOV14_06550 [Candidatus Pacearchaeota archaeon]|nr:hypothetical protein [Candidatus Pacearchaeota archaeon]